MRAVALTKGINPALLHQPTKQFVMTSMNQTFRVLLTVVLQKWRPLSGRLYYTALRRQSLVLQATWLWAPALRNTLQNW
jgi:hypothetical protein